VKQKPRVAVVFGGRSSEHAVSCSTAAGVLAAIDRDVYDVVPIGITTSGRWVLAADAPERWALTGSHVPEVTASEGPGVVLPRSTDTRELLVVADGEVPRGLGEVDVVFPLLHGPFGEDGTLQGMLELADIRYVGSGVLASAMSMDKHYMKGVLAGHGLEVGPYTVILPAEWERDRAACADAVAALGWPVFVKPARAGSSLGISKVDGPDGLEAAVAQARRHDPKVVVEAAVVGREIECAVLADLDGGPPRTSLPGEIEVVGGHDFYDFDAKYVDDGSVRLSCPADLPQHVAQRVQELAARTFAVMGCEGLARVDVFYTDVDRRVVVNEVNTMPGFTATSMYPRMWAASGVDYPELVGTLITLALRRPTGLR
jgi:D-alanine-D-alanine ligase